MLYRSVFVSDLHLGSLGGKAAAVCEFLRSFECEHLFLVGDIFDGWVGRGAGKWRQECTDVVSTILAKCKNGTRVYYTPGNHDAFLRRMNGSELGNLLIDHSFIHQLADGRRALVEHGDLFDRSCTTYRPVAFAGAWAYEAALYLNMGVNTVRTNRNRNPVDFCAALKRAAKRMTTPKTGFAALLAEHAHAQQCDVVICGHVHRPEIVAMPQGVLYANTGDWVEHRTGLAEDFDGHLELLDWQGATTAEQLASLQLIGAYEGRLT